MGDAAGGLTLQAPAATGDAAARHRAGHRAGPLALLALAARPAARGPGQCSSSSPRSPHCSYAWGINDATLETFYGAAVRSMSQSWHNFFFGAFDPWGTVTVDKLPGAFWLQALSVRLFGFHVWAVVLPQAVEGTLTVLVLYRAVRRVAGAGAGLAAAAVLAATPVTILLNRGNISDSLLILLLVLAADAATAAFMTGRLAHLLVAGVWVGLAFQAKMLQAWLVLPALFLAYLLAAPTPALARRVAHVASPPWWRSASRCPGCSSSPSSPPTTGPTWTAAATTRSSVRSSSTTAPTASRGTTLDQPGCSPVPGSR